MPVTTVVGLNSFPVVSSNEPIDPWPEIRQWSRDSGDSLQSGFDIYLEPDDSRYTVVFLGLTFADTRFVYIGQYHPHPPYTKEYILPKTKFGVPVSPKMFVCLDTHPSSGPFSGLLFHHP